MFEYGDSEYILPKLGDVIAEAEYQPYAPATSICCVCCVAPGQRDRMYMRVYENRIDVNEPFAPCCCCTQEICLVDNAYTAYYDKPPFRVGPCGPCCCFAPFVCCGNPVIFTFKPKVVCCNCEKYLGTQMYASPCNCFGMRCCICCGNPCYVNFRVPFMPGPYKSSAPLKNSEHFISQLQYAVNVYQAKHQIPENERAIFENVEDNLVDFGSSKKAGAPSGEEMQRTERRRESAKQVV